MLGDEVDAAAVVEVATMEPRIRRHEGGREYAKVNVGRGLAVR